MIFIVPTDEHGRNQAQFWLAGDWSVCIIEYRIIAMYIRYYEQTYQSADVSDLHRVV